MKASDFKNKCPHCGSDNIKIDITSGRCGCVIGSTHFKFVCLDCKKDFTVYSTHTINEIKI